MSETMAEAKYKSPERNERRRKNQIEYWLGMRDFASKKLRELGHDDPGKQDSSGQ